MASDLTIFQKLEEENSVCILKRHYHIDTERVKSKNAKQVASQVVNLRARNVQLPGSNWCPSAREVGIISTRPQVLESVLPRCQQTHVLLQFLLREVVELVACLKHNLVGFGEDRP